MCCSDPCNDWTQPSTTRQDVQCLHRSLSVLRRRFTSTARTALDMGRGTLHSFDGLKKRFFSRGACHCLRDTSRGTVYSPAGYRSTLIVEKPSCSLCEQPFAEPLYPDICIGADKWASPPRCRARSMDASLQHHDRQQDYLISTQRTASCSETDNESRPRPTMPWYR